MYLYIVSCPYYLQSNWYKLGCTENPHGRLSTYLTGCPPTKEYELQYYGIWKTKAKTKKELEYYEKTLHDKFRDYNMKNEEYPQEEWFRFPRSYIEEISDYLNTCRFIESKVELKDLPKPLRQSILKTNCYSNNTEHFIVEHVEKNHVLSSIQQPVIEKLTEFVSSDILAGQLIAPCGSGKTLMTWKAICNLKRIVICVPNLRIQEQWVNVIGGQRCTLLGGENNQVDKNTFLSDDYCILTTYASCKKLINDLPDSVELIVFDEAHHMAGCVSKNKEEGEGITRKLLQSLVDRNLKRLFLTFTPKDSNEEDENIFGMNDENVFGNIIAELKLRDLINKGVLPDYQIWALSSNGNGLDGKIEQILLAWESEKINHLIIFVEDLKDKQYVKEYLKDKVVCPVLSVENPEQAKYVIDEFNSERAILVDCQRLGEGVDIPIADSVAILYPKFSTVDIVQMVLRAGRWYEFKSLFHILIPHTNDEDMSGIQNVLINLAKYDEALRSELLLVSSLKKEGNNSPVEINNGQVSTERIHYDLISSTDIEKMEQCFKNIRISLISKTNKKEIQRLCIQRNVKTSKDYEQLRNEFSHLPQDPRYSNTTWFDFLNPNIEKIPFQTFVKTIIENNIRLPRDYTEWSNKNNYLILENIRDGYFGEEKTDFLEIVEKFAPPERRRR